MSLLRQTLRWTNLRQRLCGWEGLIILLAALALRLWGIGYDLPNLYHPDEPHHLNIAARFGTGDFNPHDFKYPTLWSYVIALVFGLLYGFERLVGWTHSFGAFAQSYLYSPTAFYLLSRIASAFFSSLTAWLVYRIGKNHYNRGFALTAGLLIGINPFLVEAGREATPYSLMIFLVACAVATLHRASQDNNFKIWVLSGLSIGLAASTHYVALPLAAWLVSFYWIRDKEKRKISLPVLALSCMAIGFLVASPYAILDTPTFLQYLKGYSNLQSVSSAQISIWANNTIAIGKNMAQFLDPWGLGIALALIGFILSNSNGRRKFTAWMVPLILTLPILIISRFGAGLRYASPVFFPLIFLAAVGFQKIWQFSTPHALLKLTARGLLLLFFLCLTVYNAAAIRQRCLNDTRTQAQNWIKTALAPGTRIFLTDPYCCPQLSMAKSQVERLLARTQSLGHPREPYYRLLLEGHPGGGYEIFYLRRTAQEVEDIPERTERSYRAQDTIDPETQGTDIFKRQGINYLALCGSIIEKRKESSWLKMIESRCKQLAAFEPVPGNIKGPPVYIYENCLR